ncbi:restriction system-associated AAA family ATPase [Cellulophaga sp. HaHa_2_95]|uniref:restriction system-associated AAA family ATPase n=1 Tax=Cellulophaga sp. HaHa_2_95 TaxID=2745558 RepID=UPI001C4F2BAE|nr:restriction system-associated AAA family ATPase [Cellulophaga sp. HaHa_2_95]QXP54659.1 restriction system-associated AAA family ATPase [Cellulophaga sp. HaHa_2_95]
MKLLRLKINQPNGFRSLKKGFEMYFLRDFHYQDATTFNPYVLAGTNGSGKSNILEALAEIFFHLDCIYLSNKPDYFDKSNDNPKGFDPKKSRIDAYELEYFTFLDKEIFPNENHTEKAQIKIVKTLNDRPKITWFNKEKFKHSTDLTQKEIKILLPEYVVGYASGNNETLSLPFFKSRFLQYDAYLNDLSNGEFVDPKPQNSLVYLDETFSQAILLTNLLMYDVIFDEESINDKAKNTILKPFKEYVKLKDVKSFRLIIRTDKEIKVLVDQENGDPRYMFNEKVKLLQNVDLQSDTQSVFIRSYLEKLKRCATSWQEYQNDGPISEDEVETFVTNSYLILDYHVNDATKQAFQFHFEKEPLKLFELFQLLLVLDNNEVSKKKKQRAYNSENIFINQDIHQVPVEEDRILRFKDFYIQKEHLNKAIYTKALSDGEHQFLHTLGLCLLFKDTRTLFLFDEPETHFNPDWKAKFISSIRNCFSKEEGDSDETMREMLITTHSPFLISDSKSDYVHIFKKNPKTGKVEDVKHPEFQTFGSSINKIGIRIFEMPNTIGEYAQQSLEVFRKEFELLEHPKQMEELIIKINKELGESVERILLVNEIINKIEGSK